jgi:hypothetical protein
MVPRRTGSEQLNVQHVRKPGQGMPVSSLIETKCPSQSIQGQTRLNSVVPRYVKVIIVINKLMILYRPIGEQGNGCENKTDRYFFSQ